MYIIDCYAIYKFYTVYTLPLPCFACSISKFMQKSKNPEKRQKCNKKGMQNSRWGVLPKYYWPQYANAYF